MRLDQLTAAAGARPSGVVRDGDVLLVLSLVYFLYLGSRTDFAESTQWIAGTILLATC